MFNQIQWDIFLQVNSKEKADRLLRRLSKILDCEIIVIDCEQYWKETSLYRATVITSLGVNDVSVAIFETLRTCSRIANRWTISAPQDYSEERWEFSGGAVNKTISLVGVAEIYFRISNFE